MKLFRRIQENIEGEYQPISQINQFDKLNLSKWTAQEDY